MAVGVEVISGTAGGFAVTVDVAGVHEKSKKAEAVRMNDRMIFIMGLDSLGQGILQLSE
jgi:hypothetical protein